METATQDCSPIQRFLRWTAAAAANAKYAAEYTIAAFLNRCGAQTAPIASIASITAASKPKIGTRRRKTAGLDRSAEIDAVVTERFAPSDSSANSAIRVSTASTSRRLSSGT